MNAVGLDLSLTATGIAPVSGVTLTVQPGKGLRGAARLAEMREGILTITTAGGVPDVVAIEGPAYSRALGAGHHEAAGLWWQVVCALHTAGIPYAVVTPSTLKKYATGRGNATKADMRVALLQRTGLDLRDDNQVDAWWLRCAALDSVCEAPVALPKAQRDALSKVEWPKAGA
ncbi:Holliday junction endonuclease [Actinomadura sp. KC06]|uniref:Holliday junction endonuclease n=1 Tax=Actinomadura sp. KC06 TaxID=2530369 RepID=UPI00104E65C5|nr:Holliday junction endonuclease [Actinomadura sp. KC06]TDD32470.1 Holliday junction endonuclease [Actinomadura sp. KC06]